MGDSLEQLLTGKARYYGTELPPRGLRGGPNTPVAPAGRNRGTRRGPGLARATVNMADDREGTCGRSRPRPFGRTRMRSVTAPGKSWGGAYLAEKPAHFWETQPAGARGAGAGTAR